MPYIHTQTTVKITKEKEEILKAKLGKAIECIPSKDESWLMLAFDDEARMWFKGDNSAPIAWVEVKIFGKSEKQYYEAMTKNVCAVMGEELGIPADRVYVKYEECSQWGWNHMIF